MSLPESSLNHTNQNLLNPRFESTDGVYTPSEPGDQATWDCNAPNGPALVYPPPIFPRSYLSEDDENMRTLLEPVLQAHAPASYTISSRCQQVHQTIINSQQSRRDVLTIPGRENYHSYVCENLAERRSSGSPNSSPSTIKREYSPDTKPDINKRGDGNLSPTTVMADDDSDGDGSAHVEPYAQLIYRALKSAPGHAMVLKEIYEWFELNTDKAKNAASKGWQNSIRHNLSMNGAFKKEDQIPSSDESKKGFIWVLEDSALREGVKSTTRYRKHNSTKKVGKVEAPAPLRQRSGAKGGKAARKAAKMRRSMRMDEPRTFRYSDGPRSEASPGSTAESQTQAYFSSEPYYLHSSIPPAESVISEENPYGYSSITGCASGSPEDPLFYESLEKCNDSMLSCDSFCDSEDSLLGCGQSWSCLS
ncbi:hypothetical protein MMC22_007228 [Lobaria immixta]|nr:hypothetical protein [Lobaria immixta]